MSTAAPSSETLRRKQVCLRARPNLQIIGRGQAGRRTYVVKDPVNLSYFHLEEAQHFALVHMDGTKTLEDIQKAFDQEFKPRRLSLEELEGFASQLLQNGLVENLLIPGGESRYRRHEEQQKRQQWARVLNIFYIKVPLLDPNQILDRLAVVGRLLFHPLVVVAAMLLVLAALATVLTRWSVFLAGLPTYQEFFSGYHLLYLWLALGLVKIFHELGHGLCSKVVGGDVHEMGLVFLFFFPTLYCNVTDSWTLPEKWKRMAISAAGIYVELLIAACAVFTWWLTDPNTFAHNLSLDLILVCSVHTLAFNANPLMRFDGYFILSDWAEIPNLAQASSRRLQWAGMRWLGMATPPDSLHCPRRFLLLYGLASIVYRCLVLGTLLWVMYLFFKEHRMEWLGLSFLLCAILALLAAPVLAIVHTIKKRGRLPEMKSIRVGLTAALVLALIGVVVFVPFPMGVRGLALVQVEPEHQHRLEIPGPGGLLDQVFVRDGQRVQQGDVLAVLINPELERKIRLNEMEQSLRGQQRSVLVAQLAGRVPVKTDSEGQAEIDHALTNLAQEHQVLKTQSTNLMIRASRAGVLLNLPLWESKGKWLAEGEAFGVIGDPATLRVAVLLDPADRHLVEEGATAWFLGHGGGPCLKGLVSEIAQVDETAIPPQLSGRTGGDVPAKHDPVTKTEQPYKQHFLVTVALKEGDPRLQVGALGRVRIEARSATLWWRFQRWLGSTFKGGV